MKNSFSKTVLAVYVFAIIMLILSCNNKSISLKDEKIPKQDRMDLAYQQEFKMTRDLSTNSIPKERLIAAEDYIKQQAAVSRPQALVNWTERGPNNIAGRIRSIMIDKADATGNTVFVGSVAGGLWKTTNFKTTSTWVQVASFTTNLAVSSIAQDPNTPATIYVGTGEGFGNVDAVGGGGVYRSTNGGSTWTALTTTVPANTSSAYFYVNEIAVDNNGYVYVGTSGFFCNNGGVFKSKNGGTSFTRVLANSFTGGGSFCSDYFNAQGNDIKIATNGDVYVTTGTGNAAKIYVSKIGGAITATTVGDLGNYTDITPTGTFTRIEIGVAPSNSATVYALCSNGNNVTNVQRSTNAGTAWTVVTNPTTTSNGSTQNFASAQAWYDLTIAVDPLDANSIVIAGLDCTRSKDGGTTFEQISIWSGFSPPSPLTFANNFMHADHHFIVFESGSSARAIFATDGGIFYSTNMTNAIGTPPTCANKNSGLNITQYYACDIMPTGSSTYVLGGTQDNGTQKFTSAGLAGGTTVTGGDGAFCHIDQTDGAIQISSYVYNRYSISTNSGTSFPGFTQYGAADQGKFINPTDYDDANNILYTCTTPGSYGRLSGVGSTNSYTTVSVTGMTGYEITALKVDPNTPTTLYIAAEGGGSPQIYRITNANGASPTFTAIPISGAGAPAAGAYLSSIDVEVGNSSHIIVTCSNYGQNSVWETTNAGTSWTSIEGNLPDMPVRWAAFIPSGFVIGSRTDAISGVYLATEMGVWSTPTLSGGTTAWVQNSTNIGNVRTDMIKVRAVDGFVAIATHGRGIFSSTLASVTPVQLASFTATKQDRDALLQWEVTETNDIKNYEVQWSSNGIDFITLLTKNNINGQLKHQYLHTNISAKNYYRVKINQLNGNRIDSEIRLIENLAQPKINVYPNPFVNTIHINGVEAGAIVNIYNNNGALVMKHRTTSSNEVIQTNHLSKGQYLIALYNDKKLIWSKKFVKM